MDLYVSNEPQKAFHKRIGLCLDLYTDAVRVRKTFYLYALRFLVGVPK